MIPTKPPPVLKCEGDWSQDFVNFIAQCLVKNPDERKSARDLLEVNLCRKLEYQLNLRNKEI